MGHRIGTITENRIHNMPANSGTMPLSFSSGVKIGLKRNEQGCGSLAKTESSQIFQIVTDMIYISCAGICGGHNFRCRRKRNPRLAAGMAGILQAKKG